MPVFDNRRLVYFSIGGFVIFMLLGVSAGYFMTTRISTPERESSKAPINTQN